ncbi:MAG: nitroreductase family protein [Pseudomonadota bacterium]|nr:nitroreductase family protein [Pseudomonadota bacterium]
MTATTDFLLNRSSEPRLKSPAPDRTTLDRAFSCAARAPDHALLRPWRYLVIEGEGLEALGELFASTCADNSDEKEVEKLRHAPLRAPMVIVGIASPRTHPKVPEIEQLMSAAAGMSFIELALQDAGYGVMWRTGAVAYHSSVHVGLGLEENEQIVGFLYTGTVSASKSAVPRPAVDEFVRHWP